VLPFAFGPRYHTPHPIISLPTIYSSSPLCYLPLLAPDITLSNLLSVSPQYTFLHSCVTSHFWPEISLSQHFYQSPHNIQIFATLLPSPFGSKYHSQHPIISLPTIYSSSFLVTIPSLTHISLSEPYYESPNNIQFFNPLLPFHFGPRYHSQHPIMILPTLYSFSFLCYLPLLEPDIKLSTLLLVSPQYKFLHPSVTFHFSPQISVSAPYYQSRHNIQFFTPMLPSHFGPRYHSQHPIISLPTI